jgi:hypothetical protein
VFGGPLLLARFHPFALQRLRPQQSTLTQLKAFVTTGPPVYHSNHSLLALTIRQRENRVDARQYMLIQNELAQCDVWSVIAPFLSHSLLAPHTPGQFDGDISLQTFAHIVDTNAKGESEEMVASSQDLEYLQCLQSQLFCNQGAAQKNRHPNDWLV